MTISFARHHFPPAIIRHAVWIYVRFTLSYRDDEDLLAERGLDVSYETVRRWVLKFGPAFARELRRRRPRPTSRWRLDEMAVVIGGRQFWLWRAVDDEGEVLDLLVQRRHDKTAAVKFMRKLLNSPLTKCVFQVAVGAIPMVTTSVTYSSSMTAIMPKTTRESVRKTKMKAARASAASLGVP